MSAQQTQQADRDGEIDPLAPALISLQVVRTCTIERKERACRKKECAYLQKKEEKRKEGRRRSDLVIEGCSWRTVRGTSTSKQEGGEIGRWTRKMRYVLLVVKKGRLFSSHDPSHVSYIQVGNNSTTYRSWAHGVNLVLLEQCIHITSCALP